MPPSDISPARYLEQLLAGHLRAQSLILARRLGLFECLAHQALNAEQIAGALSIANLRGLTKLLTTLEGLELLSCEDKRYRLSEIARAGLLPDSPESFGDFVDFFADQFEMKPEADVRHHLQQGGPLRPATTSLHWQHYMRAMERMAALSAMPIARALGLEHVQSLLDLGGGPGSYAIACCQTAPHLRATIYDLPDSLQFAEIGVRNAGLGERVRLVPGSVTDTHFGGPYDLVFLSHTIHLFAEEVVESMLRACHAALRPGGRLVVRDLFTDARGTSPLLGSLIGLHLWNEGDAYTLPQITRLLTSAGFQSPHPVEFRSAADPEVLGSLVMCSR